MPSFHPYLVGWLVGLPRWMAGWAAVAGLASWRRLLEWLDRGHHAWLGWVGWFGWRDGRVVGRRGWLAG